MNLFDQIARYGVHGLSLKVGSMGPMCLLSCRICKVEWLVLVVDLLVLVKFCCCWGLDR